MAGNTSLSLTNLIPYLVDSIKSLTKTVSTLALEISNFKQTFTTNEVKTNTICLGQTCVTETELKSLLQSQNISASNPSTPQGSVLGTSTQSTPQSTSTPPVDNTASTTPPTNNASTTPPEVIPPLPDPVASSTPQIDTTATTTTP